MTPSPSAQSEEDGGQARRRGGMLGQLAVTGLDQALLSALNFGIALVFIRGATKAEYGRYTLLNGLVLLGGGVQAALVIAPMTARGARLTGEARAHFISTVSFVQTLLALGAALLLGGGVALQVNRHEALVLGVGAALASLGASMREFNRSVSFLEQRAFGALGGDVAFVAGTGAGLWIATRLDGQVRAGVVLAVSGLAALLPGLWRIASEGRLRRGAEWLPVTRQLVEHGRWTLPGMAVTWGQNSGYSYIVAFLAGAPAVANLAAARLFIMPLNLVVTAWSKTFLPRAGALLGTGRRAAMARLTRKSAIILGSLAGLYVTVLGGFFLFGGMGFLPASFRAKYAGLSALILLWAGFALANALRNTVSVSLMAHAAFRLLFVLCSAAAAVSLILEVALVRSAGAIGAVPALILGEVVLGWTALRALRRID